MYILYITRKYFIDNFFVIQELSLLYILILTFKLFLDHIVEV